MGPPLPGAPGMPLIGVANQGTNPSQLKGPLGKMASIFGASCPLGATGIAGTMY